MIKEMKNRRINLIIGFWILLHFILLIYGWRTRGYFLLKRVSPNSTMESSEKETVTLTPLDWFYLLDSSAVVTYDISEFILYGLAPILIYFSIIYIRRGRFEDKPL